MSVNSKSMSKISDNASDGSFNNQFNNEMNTSGIAAPNYQYPKKKNKNGPWNVPHAHTPKTVYMLGNAHSVAPPSQTIDFLTVNEERVILRDVRAVLSRA